MTDETTTKVPTDVALAGKDASSTLATLELQYMPGGTLIDQRYEVWRDGVYRRKSFKPEELGVDVPNVNQQCPTSRLKHLTKVANRPVYVSGLGRRIDDDSEMLSVAFLQSVDTEDFTQSEEERQRASLSGRSVGDHWETIWTKYGQVANTRRLLELADKALPVRTSNVQAVSDYLTDCYDVNLGIAQRHEVVRRLGHHLVNGQHGWLVGKRWIGGTGRVIPAPVMDDFVRAYTTRGSESEWIAFTQKHIEQCWFVGWILACSFTAPLLRFIGQRTFIVHHFGQSSAGKTTLAKLGQSAWAHPSLSSHALNRSTQNALTEIYKTVSDLPTLFDEMQGNTIDPSAFIMQVTTETHKARVAAEGGMVTPDAKPWRTLVRTTGEQVIAGASKSDLGGQANRVVEVMYSQMHLDQSTEIYNWVEAPRHFGFAGLRFLTNLSRVVNDEDALARMQERFKSFKSFLEDRAGKRRPVHGQLAAIALGEYLMLRWIYGVALNDAIEIAKHHAADIYDNWLRTPNHTGALWSRALEALLEHRSAFPQAYVDATSEGGRVKLATNGTRMSMPIMAIVRAGVKGDEIWYLPGVVDKYLKDRFDAPPDRIWEELAGQKILERGKDRLTLSRQIKGCFRSRVYVLNGEALRKATADGFPTTTTPTPSVDELDDDFSEVPVLAVNESADDEDWNNGRIMSLEELEA